MVPHASRAVQWRCSPNKTNQRGSMKTQIEVGLFVLYRTMLCRVVKVEHNAVTVQRIGTDVRYRLKNLER